MQIVDLSKIYLILLTNFVDVDFWQNFDVECRPETKKIVDLHFARTPPNPQSSKAETIPLVSMGVDIFVILIYMHIFYIHA